MTEEENGIVDELSKMSDNGPPLLFAVVPSFLLYVVVASYFIR